MTSSPFSSLNKLEVNTTSTSTTCTSNSNPNPKTTPILE
eukprot:CAMPEP_0194722344 /NCGR_PEP_ID=MMETSP0296-20130528/13478_1 /TAXON_ID=39354 /ORGANISM="Heterosigma akashiwo, Strain CCMP2393" /LENGTH=38 /DNA_ID= /DNA_START= /DNA_END= /DNA_ORIENTATION=